MITGAKENTAVAFVGAMAPPFVRRQLGARRASTTPRARHRAMQATLTPCRCRGREMAPPLHQPHDHLFRLVFADPRRPPLSSAPACRTPTGAPSSGPPCAAPQLLHRPGSARLRLDLLFRSAQRAAGTAAAPRQCTYGRDGELAKDFERSRTVRAPGAAPRCARTAATTLKTHAHHRPDRPAGL